MANKKLRGIVWPNMPNDTYLLDAGEVDYGAEEAYRAGTVGKALQTKAEVDGYYSNLTAGSAEQLLSTVTIEDEVPYLFRTSGGAADIGDRETDMLVGGTVAWNQLCGTATRATTTSPSNGITRTFNNDGTVTLDGTATAYFGFRCFDLGASVFNHVILLKTNVSAPVTGLNNFIQCLGSGAEKSTPTTGGDTVMLKCTPTNSTGYAVAMYIAAGTVLDNVTIKPICFDLTKMFGSTIADAIYAMEQSTAGAGVAWFRKLFPKSYYTYNAGELKSVECVSSHNMVGFNAWDEEWEVGSINTSNGANTTSTTDWRSKNYMSALPNTTYHFHNGGTANQIIIYYYDTDKNYLSHRWGVLSQDGTEFNFTTPENTRFMRFVLYQASTHYGMTYNHDICINLSWDGERDGEYEPYVKHSYPLDSTKVMRGLFKLDANNNLYADGDIYPPSGEFQRRFNIVDLGTLDWEYETANQRFRASVPDKKTNVAGGTRTEYFVCPLYVTMIGGTFDISWNMVVYNMGSDMPKGIAVHNHAYTDATDFKTAMSGVYLVYELATPTTETAEPYTNPQIVDDFGTEEYVTTSIVPVGHKTQYMPNLRAKLEMAPNSPNGNGDYIVRQTNGMNEYVPLVIEDTLPTIPSTAGSYKLTVTVTEGADPVLSWEAE